MPPSSQAEDIHKVKEKSSAEAYLNRSFFVVDGLPQAVGQAVTSRSLTIQIVFINETSKLAQALKIKLQSHMKDSDDRA